MGKCLKGKPEAKPKPGTFECKKCGAVSEKKSHICKPEKIKDKGKDKKDKNECSPDPSAIRWVGGNRRFTQVIRV